ncbi:DUF5753 domain-containing protein [Streptomyces sp. NPDC003943]
MPPRRVITGRSQEPRKRFAEELKRLRLERRLSFRALGAAVGWDGSLFSKMEKGETLGGPEVVQALETYYGVPKDMLLALWELAVGDTTQFKERFRKYMSLEAEAQRLWHYAVGMLPGLLQTRAYARTVLAASGMVDEELETQVDARIGRRELLTSEVAPTFRTILSETVLRTALADEAEWREQLEYLLTMSEHRNVTIQVMLHSAGHHALMSTDVMFLSLPDGRDVAWVETSNSGTLVQDAADLLALQLKYDRVRDLALSPGETREFILEMLKEKPCDLST